MVSVLLFFTIRHAINKHDFAQGYYIEYFEDDTINSNINPITGETNPPLDDHIEFD